MRNNFKPTVTNLIIAINVAVFAILMFSPNRTVLYSVFGINSRYVNEGITYFTAAFMHGSITHLIFNMYFLYFIGNMLEHYLGKLSYTVYYIGTIIISGFLTTMFSTALAVGASGVLFAMLTTCIVLDRSDLNDFRISNSRMLINVLLLNIVITFLVPGISIAGHFSGIAAGLIASLVILTIKDRK